MSRVVALRIIAGVLAGWATSSIVLGGGFALLKASWPEYALASPDKAYTLTMLFVRLFIFSSMIAATSAIATLIAGNRWLAWVAGGLILVVSIPPHAYPGTVWDDYPPWYHVVYLLSILPIALIAGRWASRRSPAAFRDAGAA